jgi:glutamine transport system substrate-binding protein
MNKNMLKLAKISDIIAVLIETKQLGGIEMKKGIIILTSMLLTMSIFAGCSKNNSEAANSNVNGNTKKKYVIATDATYAPFEFEKDGKYVGIDIDLLAAVAKSEGFEYELKPMDFKGIIPALQAKQIDGAIAGMNITEERQKVLDMSEGYYEAGLSLVVKQDNNSIKSLEDLKGKIFAVKKGTAGAKFAEDNKEKLGSTIRYFDDTPSMFQEVKLGNADVTIEDYPVIAYMVSVDTNSGLKIAGEKLTKNFYGFAVKKSENKELLNAFNKGFKKLKDSGEYDKIVAKYIKK